MTNDIMRRPPASLNYGRSFRAVAWDDETTEDVIYLRGDYGDPCLIKKIDVSAKTVTWAVGAWADRASLEYGTDRIVDR